MVWTIVLFCEDQTEKNCEKGKVMMMHREIFNIFSAVSDEEWTDVLFESVRENGERAIIKGCVFPGFPDDATQIGMIGSSGVGALYEPKAFYTELREAMKKIQKEFNEKTMMLDFATGYGRMLRFFLKDVHPGNLVGSDVRPDFIEICRSIFGDDIIFEHNAAYPPLRYENNTFDIITAYSLFSHFSEDAHRAWLKEFERILKPDGVLVITLRQKRFLMDARRLRSQGNLSKYDHYIATSFDNNLMMKRYIAGEYIYIASGGGGGGNF
jgi:ubiquinone/menaquinone biosynthesis C-methylase UbiE